MFGISQTHITYTSCCAQQNHVHVVHNTPGSSMGPGLRTLRMSIKRLLQRILPKAHVLPNPTKSYQSASHAQGLEIVNAIRNCRIITIHQCISV